MIGGVIFINGIFKKLSLLLILLIVLLSISSCSASDMELDSHDGSGSDILLDDDSSSLDDDSDLNEEINPSDALVNQINDANDGDTIIVQPGNYTINGLLINKNLTISGNGSPDSIVIDGEFKNPIITIENENATLYFSNLTFINAIGQFGGAISINPGNVYVDNCVFINNTAEENGAAICCGGIDDYYHPIISHLFVNNSIFIGNSVGHDGGAISNYYGTSEVYNSVFINNTAERDGGAFRISVGSFANIVNCSFISNHADEWGGAYYSWAGGSNITNCTFVDNDAGTYGGAVMISGSINITGSVIVNNSAEKGGAFYITNPMFEDNTKFLMNMIIEDNEIHDNFVSDNTSDILYNTWKLSQWHLKVSLENNDWGVADPFNNLNWTLDPYGFLNNPSTWKMPETNDDDSVNDSEDSTNNLDESDDEAVIESDVPLDGANGSSLLNNTESKGNDTLAKTLDTLDGSSYNQTSSNSTGVSMGSTDFYRMTELIKNESAAVKSVNIAYFIALIVIVSAFVIGLSRRRKRD